jgi:hypothetical protein
MRDDRITLRSYRLAFEVERRLHRIDRFRIPLPYGVPLMTLGWAALAAVTMALLDDLPLLGALPWPIRFVLIPGVAAQLLGRPGEDGRPMHERLVARATRRSAYEPDPARACELGPVIVAPDERSARPRSARIRGGALLVGVPLEGASRRGRLDARVLPGRLAEPRRIDLERDSVLELRCDLR